MRPDRRSSVAGIALVGVALLLAFDPLGIRRQLRTWYQVTQPVEGPTRVVAGTVTERATRVESLGNALATDPALSLAFLVTGIGFGLVAGSTAAYLRQRRRLQRGERDA